MKTHKHSSILHYLAALMLAITLPICAQADPTFVNAADPNLPDIARGVPKGGALRVFGLDLADHGTVTLELQRFDVFAPDAKITVVNGSTSNSMSPPHTAYFRGRMDTDPDSIVTFAVPQGIGKGVRGVISSPDASWMMQTDKQAGAGIMSRKVDPINDMAGRTFNCGVKTSPVTSGGAQTAGAESAAFPATATSVQYTAHMIVDTDYEYFWVFGNAPDALEYMGDLFAYASSVYEREIHTNLLIDQARLFATNDDPYTTTTTTAGCGDYGALDEVQDEWSGKGDPRTLVHLLSGKEGGGCAYVGKLCSQSDGYGASMGIGDGVGGGASFDIDNPTIFWDTMVVAHEIGHNFNSPHTHDYCGIAGNANPVDVCVDDANDGFANCAGDNNHAIPGLGSLTGGVDNDGIREGTLMSYCHFWGFNNVAYTFGTAHPYGVAPYRVPDRMSAHVADSTACMTLDYEGSDVRVFKDCKPDDPMLVGETAICTISVQNVGRDLALGVTAVDELVSNGVFNFGAITVTKGANVFNDMCTTTTNPQDKAGTVSCELGVIGAGHTAVIKVPITAGTPQNINDRVEVNSDSPDPDLTNNLAEDEVNVVEIADVEVFKDCKPDDPMQAGETALCTMVVKNWGPSVARSVTLSDKHVSNGTFNFGTVTPGSCSKTSNPQVNNGEVTCNLGDLAAGDEVTVVVELLSDEGQNINDTAIVASASNDPDTTNNSASDGVGIEPVADLAITKVATPDPTVVAGTLLTYNITVTNNGPSEAVNVVVKDALPAGVIVLSVTSPQGSCNTGLPGDPLQPTTCTMGNLADGAVATMQTVALVAPQTLGTIGNNARVSSDLFDPDNSDNLAAVATEVVAEADLGVTKSDNPDPVLAGDILTYDVIIQNGGPSTAVDVMLTDTLPPEVTFQGYIVSNGSGTCVQKVVPPEDVVCDLNDLDPGQFVKVSMKVLVDASVPDGTVITNNAVVSSAATDTNGANDTASTDTTVNAEADLWIDKTGNFPTGNPSGTIIYTLTVHNAQGCSGDDPQVCGDGGPSDALNVVVTDTLPSTAKKLPVEFVSENCTYDQGTHKVTCMEPVLKAGTSVEFSIQVTAKGSLGDINNVADVTSSTTDPDAGNNHDELLMTVKGGTGDTGGPGGGRGK